MMDKNNSLFEHAKLFPALLLLLAILSGCGGAEPRQGLVVVRGQVTLDDEPLANATLSFLPDKATLGQGGSARTDASGHFEATSFEGDRGLLEGDYRVVVSKFVLPDGSDLLPNSNVAPMESDARELLPAKYSSNRETVLTVKVQKEMEPLKFPLSTGAADIPAEATK